MVSALKESGRGVAGGKRQRILRGVLVVSEVALSLMLLVGASLMIRTLLSMQSDDGSIAPERILTMRIPFNRDRYPDAKRRVAFVQDVLHRVESVPGVTAVGINTGLAPIGNFNMPVEIAGDPQQDSRPVIVHQTNEGYPKAMGTILRQGRFFSEQEVFAGIQSAVINEAFAARYFANKDSLGRTVRLPRLRTAPVNLADASFQIVGVIKSTVNRIATQETVPEIYIPFTLAGLADRLYVSGRIAAPLLDRAVREQIYAADPAQPVTDDKPLSAQLEEYVYARPRFNLLLFAVFAALGLVLALFGVYGVVSNTVAQRTHEIGIRLALGASFRQVAGMVLGLGMKLVFAGVVVGLLGSIAGVRLLSGIVHNVSPFDPYSFVAVTLVLFAAGVFASLWPARKAGRVDPVIALRGE